MEVGRICQWLILAGATYRIASFVTPALVDSALGTLTKTDSQRQCSLYSLTQGLDNRILGVGRVR